MDVQLMLRTAIVLLALTAAGGLLMAGIRFTGRPHPPTSIAMLHGLLAGSGLTLLLYAAATTGIPDGAWIALLILLVAAVGGGVLNLHYHWNRRALPVWMVLAHAALAVVGLVLLAIAAW